MPRVITTLSPVFTDANLTLPLSTLTSALPPRSSRENRVPSTFTLPIVPLAVNGRLASWRTLNEAAP